MIDHRTFPQQRPQTLLSKAPVSAIAISTLSTLVVAADPTTAMEPLKQVDAKLDSVSGACSTTDRPNPASLFQNSVCPPVALPVAMSVAMSVAIQDLGQPKPEVALVQEQAMEKSQFPLLQLFGTAITVLLIGVVVALLRRMKQLTQEQLKITQQTHLFVKLASSRILNRGELETAFDTILQDARTILSVDRLVIYRFNSDWSGFISTESVAEGLSSALNDTIEDACIPKELLLGYKTDRVVAINDIAAANLHPDHLQLMERLQVKANLIVPILNDGQLFGLLIAHHCHKPHVWKDTETVFLRQLALQLGSALDRVTFLERKEAETLRSQLLKDVTLEIAQAESAEAVIQQVPLEKIRQALQTDRILVYQFDENWQGTIVAEAVAKEYASALGMIIHDPCFAKDYVEKYKRGRVQTTANIYEADLTDCHLEQLKPFEVKANLVAPIKQGGQLLGLLIAHQCDRPRTWELLDVTFFAQIATQIGLTLDRANLLKQREIASEQARLWAQEQQEKQERLHQQLLVLLEEIEQVSSGDLTVRTNVTEGEIGTVADFFNLLIESLRQIVTKVKRSAIQVGGAVQEHEEAMHLLANSALTQAEEVNLTLGSMEQMTQSIQGVASSASQAAAVATVASSTAEAGGKWIESTVQNILSLRDTIGETTKKVKRLGEFSQEISKVVSLIEKISLQTNLLAINAGIEAARAGEDGAGFSVVADEIGQLAVQSTAATKEIEAIVATIQAGTSEVVEAMGQSTTQVVEGTRLVKSAKSSLDEIIQVSHQMAQLVRSISEATVSQTQTSQSVMQLMRAITQASEHTSQSSRKVATALQETSDITKELQAFVTQFKVEV